MNCWHFCLMSTLSNFSWCKWHTAAWFNLICIPVVLSHVLSLCMYSESYTVSCTLHACDSFSCFCRDLFRHSRTSITYTSKRRTSTVLPFSRHSLSPFAFPSVLVPLLAPIFSKLVKTFSYWESTALIDFHLTIHWIGHSGLSEVDGLSPEAAAIAEKMALNFP